jgi:hypothetical protein
MSVVFSGSQTGVFTSTGNAQIIQIRTGYDTISTFNLTQIAVQTASTGYEFKWQGGMAQGSAIEYKSNAGSTAVNTVYLATGGFTFIDNTINNPGASVALTAISGAVPPVVATGNTAGLSVGDIVRLFNVTGAQQLGGLDFTIGTIVANTSFTLAYMRAIAAATGGTFRRIPYNPYFYPPTRVISKIGSSTLNGSNVAIITMTVTHAFTVGQEVRFVIPTDTAVAYGMTQLDGIQAPILAIGAADADGTTNTITVGVDVSAFTAFAWPLTIDPFSTPAQVVPVGANTGVANTYGVNPFEDSEINQGFIGVSLAAGANGPAGVVNDVIYWKATKSYNGF